MPGREATLNKPLHTQERAWKTRTALLQAARKVIAREGFEHARVEDIAAAAGKSRGAFYDNFKDKEEVFFAIVEEYIRRDVIALLPALEQVRSRDERLHAFADHLLALSRDRERTLLGIEFKLYAIRHPRRRKRLADLHSALCLRSKGELASLLPTHVPSSEQESRVAIAAVSCILDGVALNRWFDPSLLDNVCLDALIRSTLRTFLGATFVEPDPGATTKAKISA